MNSYIALLRGINVSGQKKIKMADLRTFLAALPFKNLSTYIQSGNILFQSAETDQPALGEAITAKIEEHYGYRVPVIVKNTTEWAEVLANNPFLPAQEEDIRKLYVTFMDQLPEADLVEALKEVQYPPDEFVVRGRELYFFCPNGAGRSKLTNTLWERKLKVNATTRNWNSTRKLYELAMAMG